MEPTMRWMMRSVAMWIVLTVVPMSSWAQMTSEHSISGRLVFDRGGVTCERVAVELEVSEMQPVDTVLADPSCTYKFPQVTAGLSFLHVDNEGYEAIRQRIEVSD